MSMMCVKQHVTSTILSEIVPVAENAVDSFCAATKEQSKVESGWCKIRDAVVIPFAVDLSLLVGKKILSMVAGQTAA